MSNKCSIENLRMELFDTLLRLKSNNDKNCSPNEKCSIEEAETVCLIAKEITDTYRVSLQAMNILSKAENPNRVQQMIEYNGL